MTGAAVVFLSPDTTNASPSLRAVIEALQAMGHSKHSLFLLSPNASCQVSASSSILQERIGAGTFHATALNDLKRLASHHGLLLLAEEPACGDYLGALSHMRASCSVSIGDRLIALFCSQDDVSHVVSGIEHAGTSPVTLPSLLASLASSSPVASVVFPPSASSSPAAPILPAHTEHVATGQCYARVGFMGNPTDNFHGKTVSFLLANFSAQVHARGRADNRVILLDPCQFDHWEQLFSHSSTLGYTSGLRLLQATCKLFFHRLRELRLEHLLRKGVELSYSTNIPRMVGMSGSSAIVVATFKALLMFYGLTVRDLGWAKHEFPDVVLAVEKEELGISAGLQDRVIQTYGGLVAMDFRPEVPKEKRYTELDPSLLPNLYLLYNIQTGGESGKVHSTVRERWLAREPAFLRQVQEMIENTDQAVLALRQRDRAKLATCMERNFALRRSIYGDEVVGKANIAIADLAKSLGLAVKFTGSGGAFICMRRDGQDWWSEEEEQAVRQEFAQHGFAFVRVLLPPAGETDPLWG